MQIIKIWYLISEVVICIIGISFDSLMFINVRYMIFRGDNE